MPYPTKNSALEAMYRRVIDSYFWGKDTSGTEIAPIAKNNEAISAVNAAGTGLVELMRVNASNVPTMPSGSGFTRPKITTSIDDANGNEVFKTPATTSAVNEFTATNAATGTSPLLSATGGDTDISVRIKAKGLGTVNVESPFTKFATVTTDATAGAVTYTAAQLLGGFINRDPNGAGRTDILPTAALLVAAIPAAIVGMGFEFTIRNNADASETITLNAGSGGTISGSGQSTTTATIAQNNSKRFLVVLTNVTLSSEAYVIYSLGTVVH